jgi:hypothetical protein
MDCVKSFRPFRADFMSLLYADICRPLRGLKIKCQLKTTGQQTQDYGTRDSRPKTWPRSTFLNYGECQLKRRDSRL